MTEQIPPPTPAELAALCSVHVPHDDPRDGGLFCADCCGPWPCPMVRVLAAVDVARILLQEGSILEALEHLEGGDDA